MSNSLNGKLCARQGDGARKTACGIAGPNPDARFGRWCAENFGTHHRDTILNARRLWEVFGQRQDEVAFIPQSGLYALAEPKCDETREDLIAELKTIAAQGKTGRVKIKDVKAEIKQIVSLAKQQRSGIVSIAKEDGCTVDDLSGLIDLGRRYGCIYADPPWQYGNQGTRAATGNHYNGMTVDELMNLPIRDLAEENAHLHLWTTNAFLADSFRIMEAWGFEYKSCFVWVKPQMGLGNYWRVSHEFMLFGLRGKKPFKSRSEMSWGQYNRTIHSAKPEEIRTKIERVSDGPYLELFGRRQVSNWTVWGNQIARDMLDCKEAACA